MRHGPFPARGEAFRKPCAIQRRTVGRLTFARRDAMITVSQIVGTSDAAKPGRIGWVFMTFPSSPSRFTP